MADHLHKQIRAALVTKLTGLTTTATRVYANRLYPLGDASLPGLRIFLDEESAEALTIHAPTSQRSLTLTVEACAKAASGLDDTLDQISKEVEVALSSGISVGGRTLVPDYAGMSFSDEIADKPVGVKSMRFNITFAAAASAPDTLI